MNMGTRKVQAYAKWMQKQPRTIALLPRETICDVILRVYGEGRYRVQIQIDEDVQTAYGKELAQIGMILWVTPTTKGTRSRKIILT